MGLSAGGAEPHAPSRTLRFDISQRRTAGGGRRVAGYGRVSVWVLEFDFVFEIFELCGFGGFLVFFLGR